MQKLVIILATAVMIAGVVYLSTGSDASPIVFERFHGRTGRADLEQFLTAHYHVGSSATVLREDLKRARAWEAVRIPGTETARIAQLEQSGLTDYRTKEVFHRLKYDATATIAVYRREMSAVFATQWVWFVVVVTGPKDEIVDIAVYGE
jgi:hypothetical protein